MNGTKKQSLAGAWSVRLKDGTQSPVTLPGTLDENGIGGPDTENCSTRLTRVYTYTGAAVFSRRAVLSREENGRLFLKIERARQLQLTVDGLPVPPVTGSLSTPWIWELTESADGAEHALAVVSDNSYPGWPAKAIIYSSAATDETQTNWNGLLGEIALINCPAVFVEQVRLMMGAGMTPQLSVTVNTAADWEGQVRVSCQAFAEEVVIDCKAGPGRTDFRVPVSIREDAARWDSLDSHLYTMTAAIEGVGQWDFTCGVRTFGANGDGRLTINGRMFFLRGEANCCEFPETGHEPLTVDEWKDVLGTYMSYGVNTMRFHSHCPPEAAFTAADELGVLMEPELSHWDPWHSLESEESFRYYRAELEMIVRALGGHPSFVMLSLGNELHANEMGRTRMASLLTLAKDIDPSRLYAWGSNNFYGRRRAPSCGDFYTSMACGDEMLRCTSPGMEGQLNQKYPSTDYTFDAAMRLVRQDYGGPVFGFEVGQYEVLPDFDEIDEFHGVTRAVNYDIVRRRVIERGMTAQWKDWVNATGEISLMCYREEVEAVLRTQGMSGLILLGLQDFPGQGTALVGMLNAHLRAKPFDFARPERFAAFFRDVLPMAQLPARTFSRSALVSVPLCLANYGRSDIDGEACWSLTGGGHSENGSLGVKACPAGSVTGLGAALLPLSAWTQNTALTLAISIGGHSNTYPIWVYDDAPVKLPGNVRIVRTLADALPLLQAGERVLLSPVADAEHIPGAINSQFSTDFWSVGNFPQQSGAMGLYIDSDHPALADFPTGRCTQWPWWQMSCGRAMLIPDGFKPIVRVMDSYKFLRHMALLGECRVGEGRLMFSGMGLLEHQELPEVRALTASILEYMASADFAPAQQLSQADLAKIFG